MTDSPNEDGLPWGESPIDLADEASPTLQNGWRWTWGVLISSSLALALFNSHAIANWADQLPPNDLTAPIVMAADAWHDQAGRLGLNAMVDAVQRWADRARGEAPGEQ
jgi:hypothetical protein